MTSQVAITLIEILVVITIILILSATTFAAFGNIRPSLDLSGISRDLTSNIRYTQNLAVAEQIIHGICFFSLNNKYQIIKYETPEEVLQEKFLTSGISFQSINGFTGDCVKFNPYGSVREAGNIILINDIGETKTIEIKPSGFSKIQ